MNKTLLRRWHWQFWKIVFHTCGSPFRLAPVHLPSNELQKLEAAAVDHDVITVFISGGWGDTTLEKADDFTPILEGIQRTLSDMGYRPAAVAYTRTLRDFRGRLAGIHEQFNCYGHNSDIMVRDIEALAEKYPEKRVIVAGFSTGGGLSCRAMPRLEHLPNVYGITIGVPGWYNIYRSEKSLVVDNGGKDPMTAGDSNAVIGAVFRAPFRWWAARRAGKPLSWALAVQIPNHEYIWSSPDVGAPIEAFLQKHLG